ncbi:putative DUF2306 domain-containing protein [Seiridium unicorne]|uniref:DUF2306 domain-containing protein n=1 Tax=Seiridium unicorne TaxID=138068 RepID=A0ABR2V6E7_9PEZI
MVQSSRAPANAFVAQARKVYNPIGFSKGYNFVLWFIFLGALFGFTLARLEYLNIWGVFCGNRSGGALPGECFYYTKPGRYQIGIILHLGCILPAALLACLQFIPVVRHKAIIVHRVNGWLVVLLSLIGTAGAFMIVRRSFGGGLDIQTGIGLIGVMFVVSLVLAVVNIKRLQIEQHRAWMLRAWFYAGSIITLRIIMIIAVIILSNIGGYDVVEPCDKIEYTLKSANATLSLYPECASFLSGENLGQQALVSANYHGTNPVEIAAAFNMVFGSAAWLAFALHAVGIEIYLHLTPAEAERLRNVSYQRQMEAGMRHPGRSGLTADRLGDAEKWQPVEAKTENKVAAGSDSQLSTSSP